ncbi:phosphoketolase [Companilactobacillus mishanensis]|uniref:Probable phosphoketolase n=1 Tax=Companilactobacillus mishanensis TaxID=2486008 RepID=A0A5P0ZJQ6_9LACO|nr:phosphoketolase family protein [Companilactobacillus mishanensis]MQS45302.1 phosphoketolase family protein [Companilactobacillus mishanensis]MQS53278.1 phosphoketolase family protein [Companilactobacillus mishanensis]MQS90038.1 phosphoketolase family protein [Companilactobacillus mishanensis]
MTDYSSKEYLNLVDKYWRAANYISVGQLYFKDNPLLKRDVKADDVKVHPIGHWGTIAGQNFIYAHLNRIINKYNVNMFYIEGPGHGGQVMVSNSYLDGSYTEAYPEITQDEKGMQKLFKQFSFPGGVASHAAPETPGSMHEGGELGYSLSHGVGAILDNPDQIAAVVIGDGESETGPLAASWFSNTFINPVNDGAVLPILDLNGFKISNPTILSRKTDKQLTEYFTGMGWDPIFVEGDDPQKMHPETAKAFDEAIEKIQSIQTEARKHSAEDAKMPNWPVIIFRAPKGWTGPKEWDGVPIEGSFRAHQIPIPVDQNHMEHIDALVDWMKSYKPEELFNEDGSLKDDIKETIPSDDKRMASNPVVNGGLDPKPLTLPDFKNYALTIDKRGDKNAQDMIELGKYLGDVIRDNEKTFRMFGPDETMSNRLYGAFDASPRQWMEPTHEPNDQFEAPVGRIIDSQLSEHQAEGFLEGYTLTGRHGIFASYESFLRVVDSMLTQHFKWLRKADELSWRNKYPSLTVIATSTAFQQDHNGYTHQDPGIITHLAEKKPAFIREYFPADTNSLLAVMPQILNDQEKINLLVTSKQPRPQFYTIEEGQELAKEGLKVIDWASNDNGDPDIVIAAAGTEPNLESLAAISILRKEMPQLKIRFVNVVDLLKLRSPEVDPRGLSDEDFNEIFTIDKPVLFAFHGFEDIIKDIFFDRDNHNLFVHGYRENGDITTPFDMRVVNEMDRFHLAEEAAIAVDGDAANDFADKMEAIVDKHNKFIRENGEDLPEVENWKWEN